jgi:serine/threonine protein kinase
MRSVPRRRTFSLSQWSCTRYVTDIYCCVGLALLSFLLVQVFAGEVPFSGKSRSHGRNVHNEGERPPRPTHPNLTERLWSLMQRCWAHDPRLRPGISEVLRIIHTPDQTADSNPPWLHQVPLPCENSTTSTSPHPTSVINCATSFVERSMAMCIRTSRVATYLAYRLSGPGTILRRSLLLSTQVSVGSRSFLVLPATLLGSVYVSSEALWR